jgi:hypothetical protein
MAMAEVIELISNFKRIELGEREEQILECIADGLNTAYSIHSHIKKTEANFDYKNATKRMRRLHELNLVKEMKGRQFASAHGAKFYRLSSEGLFYLLTRCSINRNWLFEYKENTILMELLYPYFGHNTVLNISTNDIANYLRTCCHLFLDYLRVIKYRAHHPTIKGAEKIISSRRLEEDLKWEAKILAFRLLIKKSASDNANNLFLLEADTKFMSFSKVVEKEFGHMFNRLLER